MTQISSYTSDSASEAVHPLAATNTSTEFIPGRIASIDILRALTMVLMIFVNDLGSLRNIPDWLEHVKPKVDGMGLADSVFPAFLFIVGLSLPFAVENRRAKGDTQWQLIKHVLWRTLALITMGVFLVNGETINKGATGMNSYTWYALSCFAFILIWNVYPKTLSRTITNLCKATGILTLLYLAYIYRGSEDGPIFRFAPQWWGILGLIGWSYLVSSLITIFSKGNFFVLVGGWVFFALTSVLFASKVIGHGDFLSYIPEPVIGGTLAGLTMSGVVTASIFNYYRKRNENKKMTLVFLGIAAALIVLTVISHRYFIIAKLGATPPWLFLCSAITILAFTVIYWIADVAHKAHWFKPIKPAGTDTLLCYLIPYFLVTLMHVTQFSLPLPLITGGIGLVKSFLFAMLCVYITLGLNHTGVRLKL